MDTYPCWKSVCRVCLTLQKISKKFPGSNPRIKWLGIVSDHALDILYKESTFTVYPSIVEGFGMPILESIWQGKPVICSDKGVMSELAEAGGCLTTDILDEKLLAETMYQLSTNKDLFCKLSMEAAGRKIKTWDEYTLQFLSIITSVTGIRNFSTQKKISASANCDRTWEDILYVNCLKENWQMNNSEKLALTSLLYRHHPYCSIEIGTYKGGSLSLISQFSQLVFSIDIDPGYSKKFWISDKCNFFNRFFQSQSAIAVEIIGRGADPC